MGEKVKNKNLKLKTGITVKEADKSTEDKDNKSSDKNSERKEICEFMKDKTYSKEIKPKVSEIITNFETTCRARTK